MKNLIKTFLLIAIVAAAGLATSTPANASELVCRTFLSKCNQTKTIPVYKFFASSNGTHFITIDENEKQFLIEHPEFGYSYEGVTYNVYNTQIKGSKPVYKFFSPENAFRLYTISEEEKNTLINDPKWSFEGTYFYAFDILTDGHKAVYRFTNISTGYIYYTTDKNEADSLIGYPSQWTYNGVAYYAK